ncbi:MAG TPA: amidohydrolase family protein [Chloroflexota bacterium]|nr:amidohydrolase family protein [Chloroflexota bacterium]
MAKLPIIDCDSHVEECEATFAHLDPRYFDRRPLHADLHGIPKNSPQDSYWLIDGRYFPRPASYGGAMFFGTPTSSTLAREKPFSIPSQTLERVETRLADMDRVGIDVSVLFPTLFLTHVTDDPRYEAALMRSYNTWLAERCSHAPTRLKWAALLPLRSPEDAVAEARRAKKLGAVGVYSMGTAGDRLLDHEAFDPVWEELERQDLPLCVHVGWSHPGLTSSCHDSYAAFGLSFTLPVFMGFFAITGGGVLDRHPGLKVAFLEAGGDWLPYMLDRLDRYHWVVYHKFGRPVSKRPPSEYLRDAQIYLSVEGDEPGVPRTLEVLGEDRVMASADMPHAEARDNHLEEIQERADLTPAQKEKILTYNPARFYGLPIEVPALTPQPR